MARYNKLKGAGIGLLLALSNMVLADNLTDNSAVLQKADSEKGGKVQESSEERAYQEEMLRVSNAVVQKIAEIQAKQKELDNEVYPAYKPPLQGQLDILNQQLAELKLRKSQLEAQKTARDMSKQLNSKGQSSASQP